MRSFVGTVALAALSIACSPPAPPPPTVETLVKAAIARTSALETVHFKLDVTEGYVLLGPSLQVVRAEGDVGRPDRLRIRARARLGGVIIETEMIHSGGSSFLLDPFTARWRRLDADLALVPLLDPDVGVARLVRSITEPRIDGREDVDGAGAWRVRGLLRPSDVTALLGGDPIIGDVEVEALVGEDGLVRRLVMSGAIVIGESTRTVRRLEFSAFDHPVIIEPPEL